MDLDRCKTDIEKAFRAHKKEAEPFIEGFAAAIAEAGNRRAEGGESDEPRRDEPRRDEPRRGKTEENDDDGIEPVFEEDDDLAAIDRQVDVLEGLEVAVVLLHVRDDDERFTTADVDVRRARRGVGSRSGHSEQH